MTDLLLETLRVRFRETTAARLSEMHALLDAFDCGDGAAAEQLMRHFHALSGMGATYGYPRISDLGDEGERLSVGDAATAARWRELLAEVQRELC
jgi:chemotaxis protein histidine kinase CheA